MPDQPMSRREEIARGAEVELCHADRDGDCRWSRCPQDQDDEPRKTGRHCPLDTYEEDS